MKKTVCFLTALSVLLALLGFALYHRSGSGTALALAVTFGTVSYHFVMRLAVGWTVGAVMNNRADLTKSWYRCRAWEKRFYARLRVRRWGKKLPTFQPSYFDPEKHSWSEIAQAMCQAEVVHEIIAVLSFVPVLFSIRAGELPVFLVTSVLSAGADLLFVILQRYNRSRVMRLLRE
ncbi:MAG: hypothetical protein K6G29_12125 [Clostridiales bacterium]|nr:hypothetical protein [Clostridiales bacterium]